MVGNRGDMDFRSKKYVFLITLTLFFITGTAIDYDRYEGLMGKELADAVRADFLPHSVPANLPAADVLPAGWPEGWWPALWPAEGSRVGMIVPTKWTDKPIYDLFNLTGSSDNFEYHKGECPPGEVETIISQGDTWVVGDGYISGMKTGLWMPSADRRGDLARRLMYLALMYPQPQWHSYGFLIMGDGGWPLLSEYGISLLKKWNDDDPLDETELYELKLIGDAQGNQNPFIALPELFDYLWGDKAGQAVVPDEKRDRHPLKPEYSIEKDLYLDLYSPYVGDNASWSIDGYPVSEQSVNLSSIGTGSHIISYILGSERGKIKISVTK